MSETPAIIKHDPVWVGMNLSKNYGVVNGVVEARLSANLTHITQDFLEVEGVRTLALQSPPGRGTYINHDDLLALLGEVITRADGSTLPIHAILDEILTTFATTEQATPAPQTPQP